MQAQRIGEVRSANNGPDIHCETGKDMSEHQDPTKKNHGHEDWDPSAWQAIFHLGYIRAFQLSDAPRERRQPMV